jgi:transglutaminase-like putative cysteine protease
MTDALVTATYRVEHRTTYRYSTAMTDGYTVAVLTPRDTPTQRVLARAIDVTPTPDERTERIDVFGNTVVFIGVHRPHDELTIVGRSEVAVLEPPSLSHGAAWHDVARATSELRGPLAIDVGMFTGSSRFVDLVALGERLRSLASPSFTEGKAIVDALRSLCASIHIGYEFDPGFSEVSTPLGAVLDARRGVCQDFAHLAIGCLRSIGIAARYVSGYIETDPPPGGQRLVGADASHAWVSAWCGRQLGWIDFDPTNGALPVRRHVTIAWGRDYGDVTPVRGVVIGPTSQQQLDVAVDVHVS